MRGRPRRSRRAGALCAAIAAALALAAGTAPAASALTNLGESNGYSYFSDSTSVGAGTSVSFNLICPAGTHGLGGGLDNGRLRRSAPVDGPDPNQTPDDGWRVDTHGTSPGTITTYLICSAQNPKYVTATKSLGDGEVKRVKARCPAGTRVVSGGAIITGPFADGVTAINTTFPYDGKDADTRLDDGWSARAKGVLGTEKLKALAVCLHAQPGYFTAQGNLPDNSTISGFVPCDSDRQVVGMGVAANSDPGASFPYALIPSDDSSMEGDVDSVPDDTAFMGVSNNTPGINTNTWQFVTICLAQAATGT